MSKMAFISKLMSKMAKLKSHLIFERSLVTWAIETWIMKETGSWNVLIF